MAKQSSFKFKILITILILLGIVVSIGTVFLLGSGFFLFTYLKVARPFEIKGQAMSPNYKDGQFYLTKIMHTEIDVISRGDVIVFKSPPEPEKDYIKRVIALPGEIVMLKDGNVYINDQKLNEPYVNNSKTYAGKFLEEGKSIIVAENNFFVLGDNREYSSDSREWGFVPKSNIISILGTCYAHCK